MNGWKIEKFVSDVIWDLRQRQLLPVAAMLVVAIVVVPVALSGSSEPAPPADPLSATADALDAPQTQSAVVAYETGLRNYKKRLGKLEQTDPFVQQFGGVDGAIEQLSGALPAPSGATAPEIPGTGPPDTGGGDTGGGSPAPAPVAPTKTQTRYVHYAVDLRAGLDGQATRRNDVFNPSVLPSQAAQVALFVGLSGDAKSAVFLVSSDVVSVSGGGVCLFGTPCGMLMLKKGQHKKFVYSDGKTYRIEVLGIRRYLSSSPEVSGPPTTTKSSSVAAPALDEPVDGAEG